MSNLVNDDQRTSVRVVVDILLNKYVRGRPYLARAMDLSRDGLRIKRLFEPQNNDQDIGLQFQLPGSDRVISCAGRVVPGPESAATLGVEFTHISREHRQLIDAYIAQAA